VNVQSPKAQVSGPRRPFAPVGSRTSSRRPRDPRPVRSTTSCRSQEQSVCPDDAPRMAQDLP